MLMLHAVLEHVHTKKCFCNFEFGQRLQEQIDFESQNNDGSLYHLAVVARFRCIGLLLDINAIVDPAISMQ